VGRPAPSHFLLVGPRGLTGLLLSGPPVVLLIYFSGPIQLPSLVKLTTSKPLLSPKIGREFSDNFISWAVRIPIELLGLTDRRGQGAQLLNLRDCVAVELIVVRSRHGTFKTSPGQSFQSSRSIRTAFKHDHLPTVSNGVADWSF
jgi:hypothetical protein